MPILAPDLRVFRAVLEGLDAGDLATLLDGLPEAREAHARAARRPAAPMSAPPSAAASPRGILGALPDCFCEPRDDNADRLERLDHRDRVIRAALNGMAGDLGGMKKATRLHEAWRAHLSGEGAPADLAGDVAEIAALHPGRPLAAIQLYRIGRGHRTYGIS